MTEMSLIVTLNNQLNSTQEGQTVSVPPHWIPNPHLDLMVRYLVFALWMATIIIIMIIVIVVGFIITVDRCIVFLFGGTIHVESFSSLPILPFLFYVALWARICHRMATRIVLRHSSVNIDKYVSTQSDTADWFDWDIHSIKMLAHQLKKPKGRMRSRDLFLLLVPQWQCISCFVFYIWVFPRSEKNTFLNLTLVLRNKLIMFWTFALIAVIRVCYTATWTAVCTTRRAADTVRLILTLKILFYSILLIFYSILYFILRISLGTLYPPWGPGGLSRECAPPYPQRDRKRRLNGAVCRNHRIKRLVPCRC